MSAAQGRPGVRASLGTIRLAASLVYSAGRRAFAFVVFAVALTSAALACQLLVGRKLLDLLADNDRVDAGELAPYLVALGALLLGAALSTAIAGELRVLLGERVHRRTLDEILDVATEVEPESYESSDFHDQLQRARAGAGGQSAAIVWGLITMVSTLLVTIGVTAVLFTVAPLLVPIAVVAYVPIALVNVRNNRAKYQLERELTEIERERVYLEFLMTQRSDAQEIRAYGTAPTLRRWQASFWDVRLDRLTRLIRQRLALTAGGALVTNLTLVGTLSLALIMAGRGTISIGDAAIAIVGLQQLSGRLQSTASAVNSVHEGITFMRDFESFRAALPVIRARRPTGVPPSPPTIVAANSVSYTYPGAHEPALRSVSFRLEKGQTMAIVGANGSGKTTLAKLVCRLLTPTEGSIEWDGIDLAGCDPVLVRRQIAPVLQDYAHYMLTFRRAIGLGDVDRMDDAEAIRQAAELADVARIADAHPDGYDLRLGKMFAGGTDVSIGQWQRLAIARALFRDAPVVVLDEPSAALDPRAEADLFDLLQLLGRDRIVIFVSHRFATVRSADVVLVMEEGAVVERGSHAELMANGGLYSELFTLQADRYGLAE